MAGPYIEAIDVAYASASQAIDVSSHADTLSDAEGSAAEIVFSGSLAANKTFTLGGPARIQRVTNATTGAFDLFVQRGAGAAYFIPPGESIEVR